MSLAGVRIDPDGERENTFAPNDPGDRTEWLRGELGGWPEFARYGTSELAVAVFVHEDGAATLQPNPTATRLVERLRGGPLGYRLFGPVLLFGYDPRRDLVTDLPDEVRAALHDLSNHAPEGDHA